MKPNKARSRAPSVRLINYHKNHEDQRIAYLILELPYPLTKTGGWVSSEILHSPKNEVQSITIFVDVRGTEYASTFLIIIPYCASTFLIIVT